MEDDVAENERAGYKAALDLVLSTTNQTWARFNAMLVANTVIIAASVQVLVKGPPPSWGVFLPMVGFALCVLWVLAVARGLAYQRYYMDQTRKLEAHLGPEVSVVRGGRRFEQTEMKGWHLERMSTGKVMYAAICLFAILHVGSVPLLRAGETCPQQEPGKELESKISH
jgi:hypothetical protein